MVTIFPTLARPKLPSGWKRVVIPADNPEVQGEIKELCTECVNALREFIRGPVLKLSGAVTVEPVEDLPPIGCTAHGGPDCICTPDDMQRMYHPDDTHEFVGDEDTCTSAKDCPVTWGEFNQWRKKDPRPNLTERARKLAAGKRCTCAGAGFGTEDCAAHHPDGVEKGTHLACQDPRDGRCPGIYRRGLFREHMERWHGIKVSERSKPCPYCAEIADGIMKLGQHIARDHPGDWQAWIDGGQKAG